MNILFLTTQKVFKNLKDDDYWIAKVVAFHDLLILDFLRNCFLSILMMQRYGHTKVLCNT